MTEEVEIPDPSKVIEPVAEPVIAYRIWEITTDHEIMITSLDAREMAKAWDEGRNPFKGWSSPWLEGVGVNAIWERPIMEAHCQPLNAAAEVHEHPPVWGCQCGMWALKEEEQIAITIANYNPPKIAWGTVQLWGRVIETEFGWKGQYAKPLAISVYGITEEEAAELAEAYQCEVTIENELPHLDPAEMEKIVAKTMAMNAKTMAMNQLTAQQAAAALSNMSITITQTITPTMTKAIQQINALVAAVPERKKGPAERLLDYILGGWFFVGAAIANWVLFALGPNWFSAIAAAVCTISAFFFFRPLRKLGKVLLFAIPFLIAIFLWLFMMIPACLIGWLRDEDLLDGPTVSWVDKHDPVEKMFKLYG